MAKITILTDSSPKKIEFSSAKTRLDLDSGAHNILKKSFDIPKEFATFFEILK
jgi:hypothetical protein